MPDNPPIPAPEPRDYQRVVALAAADAHQDDEGWARIWLEAEAEGRHRTLAYLMTPPNWRIHCRDTCRDCGADLNKQDDRTVAAVELERMANEMAAMVADDEAEEKNNDE